MIELVGTLSFSNVDYVSRQLAGRPRPQFVIFDLHRVTSLTRAGAPRKFTREVPDRIAEATGEFVNIDYALAVLVISLRHPLAWRQAALIGLSATLTISPTSVCMPR